jgi:hypothetical protein
VARRCERRTLAPALLLATVLGATTGCDSSSSTVQTTGPDCFPDLQFRGVTYARYQRVRVTEAERPSKLGVATPVCAGTDIVSGDPVPIWSFPARPPTEVIGQQVYPNRFTVYFADGIKSRERDRILAAIGTVG